MNICPKHGGDCEADYLCEEDAKAMLDQLDLAEAQCAELKAGIAIIHADDAKVFGHGVTKPCGYCRMLASKDVGSITLKEMANQQKEFEEAIRLLKMAQLAYCHKTCPNHTFHEADCQDMTAAVRRSEIR